MNACWHIHHTMYLKQDELIGGAAVLRVRVVLPLDARISSIY